MAKHGKLKLGDPRVKAALAEMGVTQIDLDELRKAKSQKDGEEMLEKLKGYVKKGFRRLARELHPDVTNNDPEKTERFKFIKNVYEGFMKARFVYRPRVTNQPFRVRPMYPSGPTGDPFIDGFVRRKRGRPVRRRGEVTIDEILREFQKQASRDIFGQNRPRTWDDIIKEASDMRWDEKAKEAERKRKEDDEARDRAARRRQRWEHARTIEELQRQSAERAQQFRGMGLDEDMFYQDLHTLAEDEIMDEEPMSGSEVADDWMGRSGSSHG